MNKLLTIFLILAVVLAVFCPPTTSQNFSGTQAVAAQGGGGTLEPPFPFGLYRGRPVRRSFLRQFP